MAGSIENSQNILYQALADTTSKEKEELVERWEKRFKPLEVLKTYSQFLHEVILVRHVENYLNYITGLLFEIFTQRPEILRSNEKIDFETILSHDSIKDLVLTIAERKVSTLSYKSFNDLSDYFKDQFGLQLFNSDTLPKVIEWIETRNISVHNGCIINERYIKRASAKPESLGQVRKLDLKTIEDLSPVLANSVKALDTSARRKLKIKGIRFGVVNLYSFKPRKN
jgi:hypothetical protein